MTQRWSVAGVVLGMLVGQAAVMLAQSGGDGTQPNPYKITQTGGWNKVLKCQADNLALTVSVDGSVATPATGVTWGPSGDATAPFAATLPASQMPSALRAIGPHTLAVTVPSTTITLADGSPYIYPSATYTESC